MACKVKTVLRDYVQYASDATMTMHGDKFSTKKCGLTKIYTL